MCDDPKATKISVAVSVEQPKQVRAEYKHKDLQEKVNEYMMICESDAQSVHHWRYLKKIYEKLSKAPQIPEHLAPMLEDLERFLMEHASYDSGSDHADLDAMYMFRY